MTGGWSERSRRAFRLCRAFSGTATWDGVRWAVEMGLWAIPAITENPWSQKQRQKVVNRVGEVRNE